MGKSLVTVEPGGWIESVERIGLGGSILLILALSVGMAFIIRGPALIGALNRILNTILKHQRDKKRIAARIEDKKANLKTALDARKRNGKK